MKPKKKIRKKRSPQLRGHRPPEIVEDEGFIPEGDEGLNNEFFELNEPEDFETDFDDEEQLDW